MFDLASWLLGLGVILGLMLAAWLISLLLRNASIVDSLWSLLFVAALGAYMANAGQTGGRTVVIIALVLVWAVRLAGYITWRNWGEGEDRRYQEFRRNAGDSFWIRSLFTVFLLQGFLAWVVSLPLLAAVDPQPSLGILDVVGIGVWMVGFVFEAGGDLQLARFKADAANQGRVLDRGLWRYTRHPNYFGDSMQWWGFSLVGLAAGGWWALPGPVLMTYLLIRVSGVRLLERDLATRRPEYVAYVQATNAFFPGPRGKTRA